MNIGGDTPEPETAGGRLFAAIASEIQSLSFTDRLALIATIQRGGARFESLPRAARAALERLAARRWT